jgi:hypothetical protein
MVKQRREHTHKRRAMGKAAFQNYSDETEEQMKQFYRHLSEKEKRRYAALEAEKLGHGGQTYICRLLGCSPTTLRVGRAELQKGLETPDQRVRRPGGGRKKIREKIAGIDEQFLEIMEENTAGSPMNEDVKWTNLGQKGISQKFEDKGLKVSPYVVKQLLKKHKYVQRKMRKTQTVQEAEQRNEQFENIKRLREEYTKSENPVISLDVKKKS